MKKTERIEFIRNSSNFKMLANPHFGEPLEFKLQSIHFSGEKVVLVVKHNNKVVCVARHPKDLKAQTRLLDIHLLSVEQLAGEAIPRIHLMIESESIHLAQT